MDAWTPAELKVLKKLTTPAKIQDFVNKIEYHVSGDNETCRSPRMVLAERKAQCIEGAMFAAAALRMIGLKPLVVDLESALDDFDHVIAVFEIDKQWGAISKTNHGVLRYREPVYNTIHELVMSYFHEYFLQSTRAKTLRAYSRPVNLARFDKQGWETSIEPIWYIPEYLLDVKHYPILTKKQINHLRKADPVEKELGMITEWPERR